MMPEHTTYAAAFTEARENPEAYWAKVAEKIAWFQRPTQTLTKNEAGYYDWFKDASLNVAYLALDYHIEQGRGDQVALIYDSPVTETVKKYTYRQLRAEVERFAGVLHMHGVQKGDTVVIYMPMIPEAAIAMLACARLGAIHSVVFGGFAPHELAIRIDDAQPKVVVSASCGIEFCKVLPYKPMLDAALEEAAHKPEACLIFQRPEAKAELQEGRDFDWQLEMAKADGQPPEPVEGTHPLYVIYTSGTTGKPKGIVRDSAGYVASLLHSMETVYGTKPGEVFWAASDVGWVVGHSYIVYAPLLQGCTTVLFEGKPIRTPDAGTFWRVIEEHQVKVMFTAPTAIRAIKKEDFQGQFLGKYDTSSLRTLFLAGERCDPATLHWAEEQLGVPVIDHWWQTESGAPMLANPMGLEPYAVKAGSAGKGVPGYVIEVLREDGSRCAPYEEGAVVARLPLPPGALQTLWRDPERFSRSYLQRFPGYYLTGDGGYRDEEDYVFIMGRMDDVINVAGHRLSTGEMEEVLATHPAVAECAVYGKQDALRGEVPLGLLVLKNGYEETDSKALEAELVQRVREKIGPVAYFKQAVVVKRLPKTRSGKILRNVLRKLTNGQSYKIPSTIDDPAILPEIAANLREAGALVTVNA